MKIISYQKYRLVIPLFITLISIWSVFLYAHSTGMTGRTKLSSTPGCTCHAANPNQAVTVTISGPTEVEVNQTAAYSVTIQGGPLAAAGTDIATDNGTLATVDGSLQVLNDELTHTSPKTPTDNMVIFNFEYIAPADPGQAIIAANGNSVNLSGDNTGDSWNFADNFELTINSATAITDNTNIQPGQFKLGQNYPNPFNPNTTIRYSLSTSSQVNLRVYNILGQKVTTLVDNNQQAGQYKVDFNADNLESGTYFYILSVDGKSQSRRMVLMK